MGLLSRKEKRQAMAPAVIPAEPIRLDFGCGARKREGFQGVDSLALPGVDHVLDLTAMPWPWADGSVAEANASHFVEHLTGWERVAFVNELYRILVPGGKATIITPHWNSCRAYGDPTHQWPPVSEFWFYYLSRKWRLEEGNAPHTDAANVKGGFSCDFLATWGYQMRPDLATRNQEYQNFAMQHYKEVIMDTVCTLTRIP